MPHARADAGCEDTANHRSLPETPSNSIRPNARPGTLLPESFEKLHSGGSGRRHDTNCANNSTPTCSGMDQSNLRNRPCEAVIGSDRSGLRPRRFVREPADSCPQTRWIRHLPTESVFRPRPRDPVFLGRRLGTLELWDGVGRGAQTAPPRRSLRMQAVPALPKSGQSGEFLTSREMSEEKREGGGRNTCSDKGRAEDSRKAH